jgi:hypothetical protein
MVPDSCHQPSSSKCNVRRCRRCTIAHLEGYWTRVSEKVLCSWNGRIRRHEFHFSGLMHALVSFWMDVYAYPITIAVLGILDALGYLSIAYLRNAARLIYSGCTWISLDRLPITNATHLIYSGCTWISLDRLPIRNAARLIYSGCIGYLSIAYLSGLLHA